MFHALTLMHQLIHVCNFCAMTTLSYLLQNEGGQGLLLSRNFRSYGQNLDEEKYNMELLKKIPEGAEVASVLVGQ